MPNATEAAAKRGWEIYCSHSPRPTLDQINDQLKGEGVASPPLAPRAMKHYRAMESWRVARWMRTNEFDQWRKAQRRSA